MGFCLEGKVRDTFEWAIQLSEIKSVHDCMKGYWGDYMSYQMVMCGQNEESLTLESATTFIAERHEGMYCKPDKDYAPQGILTKPIIKKYLEEMLAQEDKKKCVLQ